MHEHTRPEENLNPKLTNDKHAHSHQKLMTLRFQLQQMLLKKVIEKHLGIISTGTSNHSPSIQ